MSSVSDIKLIRTDTTLDLSQKAEKRWPNGPRQPECCTAPAQKIWWCYCRPDCLAQNASLQVQQHNSKPSFLTAVVTAACVARRPPTNQTSNPLFQFPL